MILFNNPVARFELWKCDGCGSVWPTEESADQCLEEGCPDNNNPDADEYDDDDVEKPEGIDLSEFEQVPYPYDDDVPTAWPN